MAKESVAEKRIKFAIEEIVLSFVGALVMAFGVLVISTGIGEEILWANFILGIFVLWLGLLLFTVPLIRKVEQLM